MKKTVFVIGAGASKEVKLPIGIELKSFIASSLDIRFEDGYNQSSGNYLITGSLSEAVANNNPRSRDTNPHLHAAWRIRDAMPQAISIDHFIDAHQDDAKIELCGKLAIVVSILGAEEESALYISRASYEGKIDYGRLENTWLHSFLQLLTENCTLSKLGERLSSIAFVIFNYDRCVEHYLYHALQNYYGIGKDVAASLLQGLEIYHPYGAVGTLPWQGLANGIEFGARTNPTQLLKLAAQIKTFTEGTDPESSEVVAIQARMQEAQKIVFLGFAFHRMNLDLLWAGKLSENPIKGRRCFATAFGLSRSDSEDIVLDLESRSGLPSINISVRNDLQCNQLFREYWRSISLL